MLLCSSTNHTWRTAATSFPGALPCLCSMTKAASCRTDLLHWRSDRPPACSEHTRSSPASCVRHLHLRCKCRCHHYGLVRVFATLQGFELLLPVRVMPNRPPRRLPGLARHLCLCQVHLQPAQVQALATCASTGTCNLRKYRQAEQAGYHYCSLSFGFLPQRLHLIQRQL
jgi:hypothetical protein